MLLSCKTHTRKISNKQNKKKKNGKKKPVFVFIPTGPRTSENIRMNLSEVEFRELLYATFPSLRGVNYTLCIITRGRVLSPIPAQVEYSPMSLRNHLGRRFAGQIVIVPASAIGSSGVVSTDVCTFSLLMFHLYFPLLEYLQP